MQAWSPLVLPGEGLGGEFRDKEVSGKEAIPPHLYPAFLLSSGPFSSLGGTCGNFPKEVERLRSTPGHKESPALSERGVDDLGVGRQGGQLLTSLLDVHLPPTPSLSALWVKIS